MISVIRIAAFLAAAACVGIGLAAKPCTSQRATAPPPRVTSVPRFAIAGLMDLDNDGNTDIELVRQIIVRGGGVIDVEIHPDGKLKGQLRRDTTYLLLGKLPDKSNAPLLVTAQFDAFMRQVAELEIRTVHINELLDIGTRHASPVRERSSPLQFNPSNGDSDRSSVFRERRPPPRNAGSED